MWDRNQRIRLIQVRKHVERNETRASSSSFFSCCYYFLSNRANNFALSHWISVIGWFAYKRSCPKPTCLFFSKSQQMSICRWEYPDTTHQQSIIVNVLNQSFPFLFINNHLFSFFFLSSCPHPVVFIHYNFHFSHSINWYIFIWIFITRPFSSSFSLSLRCLLLYSLAQCWKVWSIMRDSSPSPTTCFLTYTIPIGRKNRCISLALSFHYWYFDFLFRL